MLAIVGLLVFPAVVVANLAYQRLASPLMTRAQGLRAEVSEIAHESFDGAMVVKTLGRESEETDALRRTRPTSCATSTSGPAGSAPRSTRRWPPCPTSACWSCSRSGCLA